ncbi:hypothetical protein DFH29DRAFT_377779 [Suillus ampliporus]|nr:hypothetical protein DFH29DRAFT_377779 [Suillus ampliporus]
MVYNFWQRYSELYKHVEASQAEWLQGTAHDGQLTSQLPQNYPPSIPVNSYEDPTPAVTQHQVIYGGDPTISDQTLAPADLHDAGLFPSDILVPLPFLDQEIGHRDIHSAAEQPSHKISHNYFHHVVSDYPSASPPGSNFSEPRSITHIQITHHQEEVHSHPGHPVGDDESEQPHASDQSPAPLLHPHWMSQHDVLLADHQCWEGMFHDQAPSHDVDVSQSQTQCLWTNSQGQCGFTAGTARSVLRHISSRHLREHRQPASRVQCRCRGCPLPGTIRRDTMLRHIREMHYGDKYRRKP